MPTVTIEEKGCRGCTMCSDICPVDVFEYREADKRAVVANDGDCIGCLSCAYLCPSQCIDITDVQPILPFHRIESDTRFIDRFLQAKPAAALIDDESLEVGIDEVGLLLMAFSNAIHEILGRGHRSAGRRAGAVAASHLPEMYEHTGIEALLDRMKSRLGASFDFTYQIEGATVRLATRPCGLLRALRRAGQEPGASELCTLFHEYWAGLLSAFTGARYSCSVESAGEECRLVLESRAP